MANRGVDWGAARDFYLGQDPPRSFEDVGRRFNVSGQRVGQIARRDGWKQLAHDVDREALARARQRAVLSREERVRKVLGIVDGLVDRFDTDIDKLEVRVADLPALAKLAELLEGEATDRISVGEAQEGFAELIGIGVQAIQEAWPVDRFLAVVRDRLGAIGDRREQA